jgi:hypothetical protein
MPAPLFLEALKTFGKRHCAADQSITRSPIYIISVPGHSTVASRLGFGEQ